MIDTTQIGPGAVVNVGELTGFSVTSEVTEHGQFTAQHPNGTEAVFEIEDVSFVALAKS